MAFFKFRKGFDTKTAPAPTPQESIETMRRRAKHRLLGATVLVLVAVVGFPVLFDSQPRPVSVDIPIEIPDKNKVKPLVIPPMANAPALPVPPALSAASLGASAAVPAKLSEAVPSKDPMAGAVNVGPKEEIITSKPVTKAQEKPAAAAMGTAPNAPAATSVDDGSKAKALLEGKEPDKAPAAAAEARFVVQVGAFADADKAMEVRQKLERAGLKTYAQVVDTKDGKRTRVRVGPFADKGLAEQTAEKVKALDLPVAVLAL